MKKTLVAVVIFVVTGIGYVAAGPFITIYEIQSAIEQKDSEALSSYVDFAVLRSSLKDQLNTIAMKRWHPRSRIIRLQRWVWH